MSTAVAIVSINASAQTDIEVLTQRLESMESEMRQLKLQIEASVSKEEIQMIEQKVATASEWRQPDALIHMAGYADVGFSETESEDGSFNIGSFSPSRSMITSKLTPAPIWSVCVVYLRSC